MSHYQALPQRLQPISKTVLSIVVVTFLGGCATSDPPTSDASSPRPLESEAIERQEPSSIATAQASSGDFAEVIDVSVSEESGNFTFSVTVQSPDTGCEQYADWWEVLSEEGELLYRRVLLHSHVDEQPFTRSGGPVAIQPTDGVIVRSHMNRSGYGTQAQKGTVAEGFSAVDLPEGFAVDVAQQEPLPSGCNF
ncbi:MAG: hypothetical protein WBA57_06040 [Elainellaceae cyanobacterium]